MRVLLIDAMGTLLALEDPVEPLRAELAARFGLEVSAEAAQGALRAEIAYYRRHMGGGRDAGSVIRLRRACARVLRDALPAAAGLDLGETLAAVLRFRAFADAAPALAAARAAGVRRVVVVSNWDASLPEVLAQVGLAGAVDDVVTSASIGAAKPDPAIFAAALGRAGAAPAEALHVGDSVAEDVAGARAAGVQPVLLDRTGAAGEVGCPVIAGLDALPALLTSAAR